MSDEEYTRKIVEMEAEKSGILPASPRINAKPTGRVSADFYTPRSNPYNSTKKSPEVKKGQEVEDIQKIKLKMEDLIRDIFK